MYVYTDNFFKNNPNLKIKKGDIRDKEKFTTVVKIMMIVHLHVFQMIQACFR